jgi:SAM-dependent methyltransferase
MPVFRDYAKYYDLIYKDKNYEGEACYILNLIKQYKPDSRTILDIGCGTGRHAMEFAKHGYEVTGIDSSIQMIDIAKQRLNCNVPLSNPPVFYQSDARNFNLDRQYDVVVSLFHVISYQATDMDLEQAFTTIKSHMKNNALFIFDIWYGPAVLHQKPEERQNHYVVDRYKITRSSTPEIDFYNNIVDVNYHIVISGPDGYKDEITEVHRMRYFSRSQIEYWLRRCGFIMLISHEWLTVLEPNKNSWSVCIIAKVL